MFQREDPGKNMADLRKPRETRKAGLRRRAVLLSVKEGEGGQGPSLIEHCSLH